MSNCPKCDHPIRQNETDCPRCGIIIARYRPPDASPAETSAAPSRIRYSRNVNRWGAPQLIVTLLAVAGLIGVYRATDGLATVFPGLRPMMPKVAELAEPLGTRPDPCAQTSRCLLVYVAPWCPTCIRGESTIAGMRTLLANRADIGMQVVIGLDRRDALITYADKYGGEAYIDPDRRLYDAARFRVVPSFVLVDEGRIVSRRKGIIWGAENMLRSFEL